ncbi:hypothetical protein BKI52_26650 [marine bacterium AO1-C]|nr:hypothetical protein BKI52_26650 [marine bacterium AO1-C]
MKENLQHIFAILVILGITTQLGMSQTTDKVILQLSACSYKNDFGRYHFKGEKVGENKCRIKISEMKGKSLERSYEFNLQSLDISSIKVSKSISSESYRLKVYTKNKRNIIKANIFGRKRIGNYFVVMSTKETTVQQLKKALVAAVQQCK